MPATVAQAAGPDDLAALEALYRLYLHDLSEHTRHYSLTADGTWQPSYLEDFRARPTSTCLLARADGEPAGFAMIAARGFEHMDPSADWRMAEFFVTRRHRREGVGAALWAASREGRPGRWQFEVLGSNRPALLFWRELLPPCGEVSEVPGDGEVVIWLEARG